MTPQAALFAAETLLLAFGIGATIWFFFVQTPALLLGLGMERFLPLQMRLVRVFARAMAVASVAVFALALARVGTSVAILPAMAAALAAVANTVFVVPRALRSGGEALRAVRGVEGEEAGLASFTSVGGGEPTKVWHRVLVLAVLVMTCGLLADGVDLLRGDTTARATGGDAPMHAEER